MKIVVLDSSPLDSGDVDWSPISAFGELCLLPATSEKDIAGAVKSADIVLTNKVPLGKKEIPALKDCKMIGVLATGANILDLAALEAAGILVANVPAYGVEDVAQHALALLMELARNTAAYSAEVKSGAWTVWSYWNKPPLCLTGLALGLVGFGDIGQAMGRYGAALGMNVLAWSRSRRAKPEYPFSYRSLPELLAESDVISLHCPLSPETEKLVNAGSIAAMKDGAIIINTARGGLVDEKAAADALKSGKLGGLGTDVLAYEPPRPDNPLLTAPNTLITPHMAWATVRARQNIIRIMAANIRAFLAGKPQNALNRPGWIAKKN